MIELEQYFGTFPRDYAADYTAEIVENAKDLLRRVNTLIPLVPPDLWTFNGINSGWRPASYNSRVRGAAMNSRHISAQAIDLRDDDGTLDDWLVETPWVLRDCALWLEHPSATKGWCHLQSVAPRSGKLIFYP